MENISNLIISNKGFYTNISNTNFVINKGLLHVAATFGFGDVQKNSDLNVYNSAQIFFDSALYNNLDIISNNRLYEKLKDYENKFNSPSEDFYKKWVNGNEISNPDTYDWMTLYKNLIFSHGK